jgi:hypothetical protein
MGGSRARMVSSVPNVLKMQPTKNNIIVSVQMSQREETMVGNTLLQTGSRYSENFRLKSPAVAEVIEGCGEIEAGMTIICNYNHFSEGSPYLLYDNVFSIPVDILIVGRLDESGNLIAMNGNIIVEELENPSKLELPADYKMQKVNHGFVAQDAGEYKKGDEILWFNYSNYKVLWNYLGEERSVTKIEIAEIIAKVI